MLRALVQLAAQIVVGALRILDLLLVLGFNQGEPRGFAFLDLNRQPAAFLVQLALKLQLKTGLLLLQLLLLPAQIQFLLAEAVQLRVLLGQGRGQVGPLLGKFDLGPCIGRGLGLGDLGAGLLFGAANGGKVVLESVQLVRIELGGFAFGFLFEGLFQFPSMRRQAGGELAFVSRNRSRNDQTSGQGVPRA